MLKNLQLKGGEQKEGEEMASLETELRRALRKMLGTSRRRKG